jgi:selenocysteine lyase/cysteine desulfurase
MTTVFVVNLIFNLNLLISRRNKMKAHTYAERAYRSINMDEVFEAIQEVGFAKAMKEVNQLIEEIVYSLADADKVSRVGIQVRNCKKWVREDIISEFA